MDIKKKLREMLLTEAAHSHKNKFGCLMVFLDFNKKDWDKIQDNIDKDDLYEPEGESGYGLEKDPHTTILYGFHGDIPYEDLEKEIVKIKEVDVKLTKVSAFKNEKFEVIKFDVISDDLHKLNKKFTEFPHTTDFPNYHPHATIAYCKPNTSDKLVKKINEYLKDNEFLVSPNKLVYSKVDGSKKEYSL